MADKEPPTDGRGLGVQALGIAVLSFIAGSAATHFDSFPFPQLLQPPFEAIEAQAERHRLSKLPANAVNLWGLAPTDEVGVTTHDSEQVFDGYTVYTSTHHSGAKLIDMHGEVLHEWELSFSDAWPDPPHVDSPADPRLIYWRDVHVFPNGDAVAQYYAAGATPYGYGLVKVDRDSNVLWRYAGNAHHDVYVRDDGRIYTIDQSFRDTGDRPVEGAAHLPDKVLEDFIVELSADGELSKRIPVFEAFADTPYEALLSFGTPAKEEDADWDPLHTNAIEVVGAEFAAHHDFAEAGQVLISMRSIDALALVDMHTEKVVWATRGAWLHQHDPDALANGNIMLFDNRGHDGVGDGSRVLEFDPSDNAIAWMYTGDEDEPFYSRIRSKQQRLPNGNLMIQSHVPGRIFEVTRDGEIVWEFYNPHRLEDGGAKLIASVSGAMRIPKDRLHFEMAGPIDRDNEETE